MGHCGRMAWTPCRALTGVTGLHGSTTVQLYCTNTVEAPAAAG